MKLLHILNILKEVGIKNFIRDVRNTVDKLNKSHSSVASYIQTRDGQDVLRVSKMVHDILYLII